MASFYQDINKPWWTFNPWSLLIKDFWSRSLVKMNFPLLSFRINKEIYKLRFQAYQLQGLCGWAKWQRGSVKQPLALYSWAPLWWEPSPLGRARPPGSSLEHFSSPPQGFRSRFCGERFPARWAQLPWRVERLSSISITDSVDMNLSAGLACCTPWGRRVGHSEQLNNNSFYWRLVLLQSERIFSPLLLG